MAKIKSYKFFSVLVSLLAIACAEGHCRQVTAQESPQKIRQASLGANPLPADATKRVLVYKDDGSLQCSKKRGQSPSEMAKTLAPIEVFTSTKKPDGLMHLQVCGQKTGQVNVFEILESDLPKAQQKDFKLWNLD